MPKLSGWFDGDAIRRFYAFARQSICARRTSAAKRFSFVSSSLGAVIILLTWLYICGLMLLLGAEINKEIEVAAVQKHAENDVSSTGA